MAVNVCTNVESKSFHRLKLAFQRRYSDTRKIAEIVRITKRFVLPLAAFGVVTSHSFPVVLDDQNFGANEHARVKC